MDDRFFKDLKIKIHKVIMAVYDVTADFPKSELYGVVSQLRRAIVSVMLNLVEGFGRRKPKVKLNFFEISYGSLKESKYLMYLALKRGWLSKESYDNLFGLSDEIGAMLWSMIVGLEKDVGEN